MSVAAGMPANTRGNSATSDWLAFRAVCATFATGVTVVTTSTPEGPHGATVNAFTSLTVDPPQVLVCLAKDSRTWKAVERSGRFAVNILSAGQEQVARRFASHDRDKMGQVRWHAGINGSPVLEGVVGVIECDLSAALEQSTHMVVVGAVTHAGNGPGHAPLIFFRSRLYDGLASVERQ